MHYSEEDPIFGKDYASKRWTQTLPGNKVRVCINLYFNTHVEKWYVDTDATVLTALGSFMYSGTDAWKPRVDDEGGWLAVPGRAEPVWGVPNQWDTLPVFHFRYLAGSTSYGTSRMAPAIPVQKGINMLWANLLGGADMSVLRQKWAIGYKSPEGPLFGPDRLIGTDNPEAKFGTFEASSLKDLIDAVRLAKEEVATSTRTPLHMLLSSKDAPSGESLKSAEAPLVKDVESTQISFSTPWVEAMTLACRMKGQSLEMECVWDDPASRSDLTDAQAIKARVEAGLPRIQALKEMGYSKEEIDEMLSEESESDMKRESLGGALMTGKFDAFARGEDVG